MMKFMLLTYSSVFIIFCIITDQFEVCKCYNAINTNSTLTKNIIERQINASQTDSTTKSSEELSNNATDNDMNETVNDLHDEKHGEFHLLSFNWLRVSAPYVICLWMTFAGLSKIFLQHVPKLVSRVPESCILICLGLVVGGMFYAINSKVVIGNLIFENAFFLYILPPIVMEAGYFMPKRYFFGNIGTILLYAFVGTIFNATAIACSLYGVHRAGLMPELDYIGQLTLLDCFLFGTIISAVDPVAVISVFEEIHVNTVLYICVFAESLLNDGVVVVLYNIFLEFKEIGEENIAGIQIFYIFLTFFIVVFGAVSIGIFYGYLCSFITKYTVKNQIIEPTLVFAFCYLSYLTAELFHISGILAMVVAAISMSTYVEQNISEQSLITVKFAIKMLSNIAETLIFMVLGVALVSDFWESWNTGFVLWTLLFCLIYRPIGVFVLSKIANSFRIEKINGVDQFVMAYGGLRGAIAFALVTVVDKEKVPTINAMVCACIVVILFTSFVQGATIRPIVELLNVKTMETHMKSLMEDITGKVIDHLMAGVEDVIGHHGHHYWMQRLNDLHYKYVAQYFTRGQLKSRDEKIFETFHRINRRDAEELVTEIEKGSAGSRNEIRQVFTLTTLLFPPETRTRKSFSSASMRMHSRENADAILDMNQPSVGEKVPIITQEADLHHLLQQNMYQTRKIERTRYRRGEIAEDYETKRQENEILMRRRLSIDTRKHRHHKNKHVKKEHPFPTRFPTTKRKLRSNISTPIFHQTYQFGLDDSQPRDPTPSEDMGITFTVPTNVYEKTSYVNKFGPIEEEVTVSTDVSFRGPLSFMDSYVSVNEVEKSESEDKSVAIDRQLPWKRTSNDIVADPHTANTSSKQPLFDEQFNSQTERLSSSSYENTE